MRSAKLDEAELAAFCQRLKDEPGKAYAEQEAARAEFLSNPENAEAVRMADYRIDLAARAEATRKVRRSVRKSATVGA